MASAIVDGFATAYGRYCATRFVEGGWLSFGEVIVTEADRQKAEADARRYASALLTHMPQAELADIRLALEIARMTLLSRTMEPYHQASAEAQTKIKEARQLRDVSMQGLIFMGEIVGNRVPGTAPLFDGLIAGLETWIETGNRKRAFSAALVTASKATVTVPFRLARTAGKIRKAELYLVTGYEVVVEGFVAGAASYIRSGDNEKAIFEAVSKGIGVINPTAGKVLDQSRALHDQRAGLALRLSRQGTIAVRASLADPFHRALATLPTRQSIVLRHPAARVNFVTSALRWDGLTKTGRAMSEPVFAKGIANHDVQAAVAAVDRGR